MRSLGYAQILKVRHRDPLQCTTIELVDHLVAEADLSSNGLERVAADPELEDLSLALSGS
jgi:hypothetical protein